MRQIFMIIPVVPSKREVIEIPSEEYETLYFSKFDLVCVDGGPHKPTGPAFIPGIVRGGDEPAKRQGLLLAIHFHNLKYRPAERTTAIRCSPHAGLDESLAPWNDRLVSWGMSGGIHVRWLGVRRRGYYSTGQAPAYRTMTSGGRTISSGGCTTTTGGPTMTAS
jgi:hypothetical protein